MSSSGLGSDGLSLCCEVSVTKLPLSSVGAGLQHRSQITPPAAVLSPPWECSAEFHLPPDFGTLQCSGCRKMPTASWKHRVPTRAARPEQHWGQKRAPIRPQEALPVTLTLTFAALLPHVLITHYWVIFPDRKHCCLQQGTLRTL